MNAALARTRLSVAELENGLEQASGQNDLLRRELLSPSERSREESSEAEIDRSVPSYLDALRRMRRGRANGLDQAEGLDEPIFVFNSKLASLEFAAAHGAATPGHEGPWDTPDQIPFEDFGDRLVVKCTHGFGARGVYPLVRNGDRYFDAVSKEHVTQAEVVAALGERDRPDAKYYVEEFIASPDDPMRQANDVKVYAFYGVITHVEVWRDKWTRYDGGRHGRVRGLFPDGTPMGHPRPFVDDGADLGVPADLGALVDLCTRMSLSIRRPFARFDFFESDKGWVFAELAKNPSATPAMVDSVDVRLGGLLEEAHARLLNDLVAEDAFGPRLGSVVVP